MACRERNGRYLKVLHQGTLVSITNYGILFVKRVSDFAA